MAASSAYSCGFILDLRGLGPAASAFNISRLSLTSFNCEPIRFRRRFSHLANELAGGRIRHRGDPLEAEIDQRQADDEDDTNEQRNDRGF